MMYFYFPTLTSVSLSAMVTLICHRMGKLPNSLGLLSGLICPLDQLQTLK